MSKLTALFATALLLASTSASSFMPAGGLWVVNEERTGKPGRGFQIEVENEVMILTYYGYRADGTSVYYLATGPIKNNTFSAPLQEYAGGRALGGLPRDATAATVPGTVTATFSNGKVGTITFPGEGPKAISKFEFGYGNSPEGLRGTYLYAFRTTSGTIYSGYETLDTVLGPASSSGNGMVTNSSSTFVCEHQISGALAGDILCAESPGTDYSDMLLFRMSGDRGTGTGFWKVASDRYPLHVLRVATKSGAATGILDGIHSQLLSASALKSQVGGSDDTPSSLFKDVERRRVADAPVETADALTADQVAAQQKWMEEIREILSPR